ncbi:hypothetical protein DSL64_05070 [Dyadobacter luteus]|uniref:Uncharacterized protein n=2 Tax=Dyadobacter luteus TaxID=2259619 RepID=A0A3D8YGJ7_9BACT|nr:hypothetical protein DSL64_05070 [Dyadobacter luteus]
MAFIANSNTPVKSQDGWGEWFVVNSRYEGIVCRVKRGDFNNYARKWHWEFQFENRYSQDVSFGYGYRSQAQKYNCVTDRGKTLQAGDASDVTAALIDESGSVRVCVDNVRFR